MSEMRGDLLDRVVQTINRYSMLEEGDRIGVAVSGGADSVFLLYALRALASDRKFTLSVLHVNHQIRGKESDADEQFVRNLAGQLDLPFVSMRGRVGPGNLEQEARNVRRRLFEEAKRELGLSKIALGHSRTDQAETVLFRMLRGSGICGLSAIPPIRQSTIRPLLAISRTEIREALSESGLLWREDTSNQNERFIRNRLRLTTLPTLTRAYNPNLEQALAGTAELSQVEEDYWAKQVNGVYARVATHTRRGPLVDVKSLADHHLAVRRRLIRHAILRAKGSLRSIDRRHVDEVLAISESRHGHDRVNIPGVDAIRSFDHLLLAPPEALKEERDYLVRLELETAYQLPFAAGVVRLTIQRKTSSFCATVEDGSGCDGEEAFLDWNAVCLAASTGDLAVRNWQPGDKLQQLGQGSAVKVKTLFQEHKIFLWSRRHWPVIVAGKEIVWVRGFGAAQPFAASDDSRERVRVCFEACD
ncbi:MAG: tRNA lysidine(34) synthetase TilS [Bryobacteraceae bacterium]